MQAVGLAAKAPRALRFAQARTWRRVYVRRLSDRVRTRLARFDRLTSIDPTIKQAIRPWVRRHERDLAKVWGHYVLVVGAVGITVWLYMLLYSAELVAAPLLQIGGIAPGQTGFGFLAECAYLAAGALADYTRRARRSGTPVRKRRWYDRRAGRIVIGLVAVNLASIVWGRAIVGTVLRLVLLISVAGAAGLMVSLLPTFVLVWLLASALCRWTLPRSYQPALVHECMVMLETVEADPCKWQQQRTKDRLYDSMRYCATCIERGLPWSAGRSDTAAVEVVRHNSRAMAAAVRSLAIWIAIPKADTQSQLRARVAELFRISALGEWDSLERLDPDSHLQQRFLRQATSVLLKIGVPALALEGVSKLSVQIPPQMQSAAPIMLLLWTAAVLATAFRCRLADELALLQQLVGWLPIPWKSRS